MKAKKRFLILVSMVLLFSCCSVSAHSVSFRTPLPTAASVEAPDRTGVLFARFLNMLNHNFAYGEDYQTEEALVNAATLSLRDCADEDGFIPAEVTASFVRNFYGIEVMDLSVVNAAFGQREGYVYLIPRGFTVYSHKPVSLTLNEDGTYTVLTRVTKTAEDGEVSTGLAETLFVPDAGSDYGFYIVRSDFLSGAAA